MDNSRNGHVSADEIRAEVKRLIAEVTEREPDEIADTALFTEDLGVDSLMAMEIMVTLDKRFKIDLPEEEFNTIKNVDDAVAVIEHYLSQRGESVAAQ